MMEEDGESEGEGSDEGGEEEDDLFVSSRVCLIIFCSLM